MRVLVIEDESRLAEVIARRLRREGMALDLAHDGRVALYKTAVVDYDALVLDRDLPEVHGDEVCVRLVEAERTPRILTLTASAEERLLWSPGTMATIAGFGVTGSGGDQPEVLHEAEVPITPDDVAAEAYPLLHRGRRPAVGGFESDTQVAAGFLSCRRPALVSASSATRATAVAAPSRATPASTAASPTPRCASGSAPSRRVDLDRLQVPIGEAGTDASAPFA